MAEFHGKLAAELLAPPDTPPDISHGEVIPAPDTDKGMGLRDTLRTPDMPAIDASIDRTDLPLADNLDVAALAVDAAKSIDAGNSLEKMLAHQLALAHSCAFRFMDTAAGYLQRAGRSNAAAVEAARLTNAACAS